MLRRQGGPAVFPGARTAPDQHPVYAAPAEPRPAYTAVNPYAGPVGYAGYTGYAGRSDDEGYEGYEGYAGYAAEPHPAYAPAAPYPGPADERPAHAPADPYAGLYADPYADPYADSYVDPRAGRPVYDPVPRTGGGGGGRRRRGTDPADGGLRRLVPRALVVVFLAGGTSAFVAGDKAVRLTVDGEPRTLHTFADDVRELLADTGVDTGVHDVVSPAPGEELTSGDDVVVRYGRPVALTLDGERRRMWTTARTVGGALRELGVRAQGAYLSASPSAAISRAGLALDVRTERTVTFMADGHERVIRTNAATVGEALAQAGITLGAQDTTSVPAAGFPRDGQTVTVMRITGTREVREEPIPYDVVRVEDATLFEGTEIVVRQGRPGARRLTHELRTVNGVRQRPRKISDEVVREPVAQRVHVGTRRRPEAVPGADGLNWEALARCESGGRAAAVDAAGLHGGLYQFDAGTWQALGGRGRPQDAAAAEQTFRAKKLYIQRGATPWPHCGRSLYR
ncbi:ubiquitin-like domain-containing protein [Streptomyces sp. NPDC014894]|uniref:ubiquitin-like domain-containing protein n=1 Tax=Streptomyces sp. NPDC014894 TaxID=3364931 RepID=UPI00370309F4